MIRNAAVVLAAGKGTRMRSQIPKVLHRICGKEMLGLVLDTARTAGLEHIVVVVPSDFQDIVNAVKDRAQYAQQQEPLGTGHALLQARSLVESVENVVVLYGDVPLILPSTLGKVMRVHDGSGACMTLLTAIQPTPDGLGRVLRSESGQVEAIVEEADAGEAVHDVSEINAGVYCIRASWLWDKLVALRPSPRGETYLTDLVAVAARGGELIESVATDDPLEALGVNTRVELAAAENVMRKRIRESWMLRGVTMRDPSSVYIDADAQIGQDTSVLPNTHICGNSQVGTGCTIGPNSIVSGSVIGNDCTIVASVVEGSALEDGVDVGPLSHIRPGSHLERGVHIGNFAEVKNSHLGPESRSGHFSYIGDAEVGANVNVGAGTVTCNYDGKNKNATTIGDDVFIGSGSMLVAPIKVGERSSTGAGSVVTKDVPPDSLAVGAPARILSKKRDVDERGVPTQKDDVG